MFGHRQDGARLRASIKARKASVREVVAEIVARNPSAAADGLTVERLMEDVEVDPEDASHVLGDLDGRHRWIAVLHPVESFNENRFPGLILSAG